jgi:ADP-sugar diphosphatase
MRITILDHLKSLSTKVLEFKPFIEWQSKLNALNQIETTEIIVSDVDLFGNRVGFVKAKAISKFKDTESHLPGIAFLRGGAVSILCILYPTEEKEEPRVILTQQVRIPVGSSMIELPAGMLDESGDFSGMAAQELKEECGIIIRSDQLLDLTGLAFDSEPWVYPSAGGCDEFVKLFLYQEKVPLANIIEMENRLGGLDEHGERIHLRVVKLSQVWKITRDVKAHSSLYLLDQLKKEGKIKKLE